MDAWVNVFTNLGIGGGVIVATMFGVWKTSGWVGRELVIPARDRFLKRVDEFFDRLAINLDRMEVSLETISQRLADQATMCKGHREHLEQITLRIKGNP